MTRRSALITAFVGAVLALGAIGSGSCFPVRPERVPGGWTAATGVASGAAPDRGVVVRLTYPDRPRYPGSAAAVVELPGADTLRTVELSGRAGADPYVAHGVVHVEFAFPGGGRLPLASGGSTTTAGWAP